jgi:hypothetical protein
MEASIVAVDRDLSKTAGDGAPGIVKSCRRRVHARAA